MRVDEEDRQECESRKAIQVSFWGKWWELQRKMLKHNAALVDSHPNKSQARDWPWCLRGLPFWEKKDEGRRMYLLGCPTAWIGSLMVTLAAGVWLGAKLFWEHRTMPSFTRLLMSHANRQVYLFSAYSLHYLPFFAMSRSLYLHHYLPAQHFSVLAMTVFLDELARRHEGTRRQWIPLGIALVMAACSAAWFAAYAGPLVYSEAAPKDSTRMLRLKLLPGWDWP